MTKLKLKKDEEGVHFTEILDEELDSVICKFNNDGCATIHTEDLGFIILNKGNLLELSKLIDKAEKLYEDEI